MPRHLVAVVTAMLVLLVAAPAARATRFDPTRLPADAEAVGHLDVDALRSTQLFGGFIALAGGSNDLVSDVPAGLRPLVEELLRSAIGLSFWVGGADESGAILISVRDAKAIGALVDKLPTRGTVTLARTKVRRIDLDGESRLVAAVGTTLVVSDTEASMTRTLNVLGGNAKSLAGRSLTPLLRDPGVFFFTAVDDTLLKSASQSASSALLKADLTALTLAIGEVKAELRVRAIAEVATADGADQIKKVIDGLRALVLLADDTKELAPLLDKTTVTVRGKRVEVAFAMRSTEVIKLIKAAQTK